ncbi:MAG: squalene/phytoene synthase family protein [Pseudomonadota bacterium]
MANIELELLRKLKLDRPDRYLIALWLPARIRSLVACLFLLEHEWMRAPTVASEPMLAEIRLTWWLEALGEVFAGKAPRRHPLIEGAAELLPEARLQFEDFANIIEARIAALYADEWSKDRLISYCEASGGALSALAATAAANLCGVQMDQTIQKQAEAAGAFDQAMGILGAMSAEIYDAEKRKGAILPLMRGTSQVLTPALSSFRLPSKQLKPVARPGLLTAVAGNVRADAVKRAFDGRPVEREDFGLGYQIALAKAALFQR